MTDTVGLLLEQRERCYEERDRLAARVRELEAACEAILAAEEGMGVFPPTDTFWEHYSMALEKVAAALGGQEPE